MPPRWDLRGWDRLAAHEDPPLVAAREEYLAWLAEVPPPHKADLDARLRSTRDDAHCSARLELFVHHYFMTNGWAVQIHPRVASSANRPDFLATKPGAALLVECRTVFDQDAAADQDQRIRQLADEAGRRLARTVILQPLSDLPPGLPSKNIRSWLEGMPVPDNVNTVIEDELWGDHQGHHYGVRAIIPNLHEDGEALPGVHGLISQARTVSNVQRLRAALREKARKYGPLDSAFLVATYGATEFPLTPEQEVDALFGDRVWHVPRRGSGPVTESRTLNGIFTEMRDGVPRYGDVSALLVYRLRWTAQGPRHLLHVHHNPLAYRPIDPELFPDVPQFVRDGATMRWIHGEPRTD